MLSPRTLGRTTRTQHSQRVSSPLVSADPVAVSQRLADTVTTQKGTDVSTHQAPKQRDSSSDLLIATDSPSKDVSQNHFKPAQSSQAVEDPGSCGIPPGSNPNGTCTEKFQATPTALALQRSGSRAQSKSTSPSGNCKASEQSPNTSEPVQKAPTIATVSREERKASSNPKPLLRAHITRKESFSPSRKVHVSSDAVRSSAAGTFAPLEDPSSSDKCIMSEKQLVAAPEQNQAAPTIAMPPTKQLHMPPNVSSTPATGPDAMMKTTSSSCAVVRTKKQVSVGAEQDQMNPTMASASTVQNLTSPDASSTPPTGSTALLQATSSSGKRVMSEKQIIAASEQSPNAPTTTSAPSKDPGAVSKAAASPDMDTISEGQSILTPSPMQPTSDVCKQPEPPEKALQARDAASLLLPICASPISPGPLTPAPTTPAPQTPAPHTPAPTSPSSPSPLPPTKPNKARRTPLPEPGASPVSPPPTTEASPTAIASPEVSSTAKARDRPQLGEKSAGSEREASLPPPAPGAAHPLRNPGTKTAVQNQSVTTPMRKDSALKKSPFKPPAPRKQDKPRARGPAPFTYDRSASASPMKKVVPEVPASKALVKSTNKRLLLQNDLDAWMLNSSGASLQTGPLLPAPDASFPFDESIAPPAAQPNDGLPTSNSNPEPLKLVSTPKPPRSQPQKEPNEKQTTQRREQQPSSQPLTAPQGTKHCVSCKRNTRCRTGPDGYRTICTTCNNYYCAKELQLYRRHDGGVTTVPSGSVAYLDHVGFKRFRRRPDRDLLRPIVRVEVSREPTPQPAFKYSRQLREAQSKHRRIAAEDANRRVSYATWVNTLCAPLKPPRNTVQRYDPWTTIPNEASMDSSYQHNDNCSNDGAEMSILSEESEDWDQPVDTTAQHTSALESSQSPPNLYLSTERSKCLRCNSQNLTVKMRTGPDGYRTLCQACSESYRTRKLQLYQRPSGRVTVVPSSRARPVVVTGFFTAGPRGQNDLLRPYVRPVGARSPGSASSSASRDGIRAAKRRRAEARHQRMIWDSDKEEDKDDDDNIRATKRLRNVETPGTPVTPISRDTAITTQADGVRSGFGRRQTWAADSSAVDSTVQRHTSIAYGPAAGEDWFTVKATNRYGWRTCVRRIAVETKVDFVRLKVVLRHAFQMPVSFDVCYQDGNGDFVLLGNEADMLPLRQMVQRGKEVLVVKLIPPGTWKWGK